MEILPMFLQFGQLRAKSPTCKKCQRLRKAFEKYLFQWWLRENLLSCRPTIFSHSYWRISFFGINGGMAKPLKNLEKWMLSPYLLPTTTTKAPSLCLVMMDILAKHKYSIQKIGKRINGDIHKPMKCHGKMDVFPIFATTNQPYKAWISIQKLENIHFWEHAQTCKKPWKMDIFSIFTTTNHKGHHPCSWQQWKPL